MEIHFHSPIHLYGMVLILPDLREAKAKSVSVMNASR
jgi:hypothetical protein